MPKEQIGKKETPKYALWIVVYNTVEMILKTLSVFDSNGQWYCI